jgi:hypothetical protein
MPLQKLLELPEGQGYRERKREPTGGPKVSGAVAYT